MMKIKHLLAALLILAAGGLAAKWLIQTRREVKPQAARRLPPLVRVMEAAPARVQLSVRSQGTVMPRTEITVSPEVAGRVRAVSPSLAAGGFFEAGEVLAAIDPADFELAVVRAQAQVAAAEARLAREQAEAAVARQEWAELNGAKELPPLVAREPQLAEARAALAAARAAVEEARRNLAKTEIRAPFAGRVISKNVDLGQFVAVGAVLARIQAVDWAEVRLPVPVDQMAFVDLPVSYRGETPSPAQPTVLLRGTFAGRAHTWTGAVIRTESQVDPQSRMVMAVARVEDPYARANGVDRPPLAAGLFVEAEILGRVAAPVFQVPRTALRHGRQVLLVDAEGKLRFQPVEVLKRDREFVLVKSGLAAGDRLCLSPLETPVEGMTVRVATNAAPAACRETARQP